MQRLVMRGTRFHHVLFVRDSGPSGILHIYIDGDGRPWLAGVPAPDPTPRDLLVLRLMALDPRASVYLGRPCYHGLAKDEGCSSATWTDARYSDTVLQSLAAAAERLISERGVERVVWVGYSGGGVLAMLLAPRFTETAAVVTVGANLDIDAWADAQRARRLAGSLNPALQPPLPARVYQRHYVGADDDIVPPSVVARAPIAAGTLRVIPSYTHSCCWTEMWPSILAELDAMERKECC
jgi:pimeloyl-ACP methyl ester carboxylesterase